MNYETQHDARQMYLAAVGFAKVGYPHAIAGAAWLHDECAEVIARAWAELGDADWIDAIIGQMGEKTRVKVETMTRELCQTLRMNLPDSLAQIELELDA